MRCDAINRSAKARNAGYVAMASSAEMHIVLENFAPKKPSSGTSIKATASI